MADIPLLAKICTNCGGTHITLYEFVTACDDCGASLDPKTGKPFMDEGKVVLAGAVQGMGRVMVHSMRGTICKNCGGHGEFGCPAGSAGDEFAPPSKCQECGGEGYIPFEDKPNPTSPFQPPLEDRSKDELIDLVKHLNGSLNNTISQHSIQQMDTKRYIDNQDKNYRAAREAFNKILDAIKEADPIIFQVCVAEYLKEKEDST